MEEKWETGPRESFVSGAGWEDVRVYQTCCGSMHEAHALEPF